MVEILIVSTAALLASALTLFSGFGLGTLLMPVVAIFFPVEVAIAMTALVHLANNLFKIALFGRYAQPAILFRFGLPAFVFAFLGASILAHLSHLPPLYEYQIGTAQLQIYPLKLVVGLLILFFTILELSGSLNDKKIDRKFLPIGGVASGFFGGLSGHQGAFRSMFLIKSGLSKEAFVGNGIVLAVMVDVSRLSVYGWDIAAQSRELDWGMIVTASIAAFVGAYCGARLLKKLTIRVVQIAVSALLSLISVGLIVGVL